MAKKVTNIIPQENGTIILRCQDRQAKVKAYPYDVRMTPVEAAKLIGKLGWAIRQTDPALYKKIWGEDANNNGGKSNGPFA